MSKKKAFIALKENEEAESISSFFELFQYESIKLSNVEDVQGRISPVDILIIDLYFLSQSILQTNLLPKSKNYKIFVVTPRTLFEKEEEYAQEAKMNILKKPINYDVLYSRLLDQMEIQ